MSDELIRELRAAVARWREYVQEDEKEAAEAPIGEIREYLQGRADGVVVSAGSLEELIDQAEADQ